MKSAKFEPTALAIGNFDGVHLGHRQIIKKTKELAKKHNISSAILTFEPHPISLLKPDKSRDFRLISLAQKLKILKSEEIDLIFALPFNLDFAALRADEFINKILLDALNVQHLIIGYDFIFGKNREGNLSTLQQAANLHKFSIHNLPAHKTNSQICSSTLIRNLIKQGDVKGANQLLGSNFTISGSVIHGRNLASSLGFPTANIKPKDIIIKPKFGVYSAQVFLPHLNKKFPAILNFGLKPTIGENLQPLFEAHIFNFSQEIYGKKIEVELLDFIREEKKFDSLDALRKQIIIDASLCRAWHENSTSKLNNSL